jgi:predicted dehydrogenase/flavin reductase (DIM6/NTAB) family NADH-FMN oxidoreductase RutF
MRWPGRTIWDTRIQDVCGIIAASIDSEVHLFASASFAQASLDPPRVIINPNRTYGIEEAIQLSRRFSINVLPVNSRLLMINLMKMRRRQLGKEKVLGISIVEDHHRIPFFEESLRTIFCEVEGVVEGGDRRLYIANVIESRSNPTYVGEVPLLFSQVTDGSKYPALRHAIRTTLVLTGALDAEKRIKQKLRRPPPANIASTTYEIAGATEQEIGLILRAGAVDRSRKLRPPQAAKPVTKTVGICVVGTGWGQTHARYLRQVGSNVRLFICGQNRDKTNRIARNFNADGCFYGLEEAIEDKRVNALTLALPHHLHRRAVEMAAASGKHILLEKPIATNLTDADAMIDASRSAGVIFMVAEDMHFRPAVGEAVALIERGAIGEPLYLLAHAGGVRRPVGWAADKEQSGGGVLMDIGVHYVRALRLLMGEPDSVFASRAMQINTRMSGEDSVQLVFSSRYGWQGHLLASWSSQRGHLPDIVIAGEKGTIHLWPRNHFVDYYPVEPRFLSGLVSYVRPYVIQQKLMRPTLQRIRKRSSHPDATGYLGEMKEFVAAVVEGRAPATSARDARRDLEVVLRSYESLQSGAVLAI